MAETKNFESPFTFVHSDVKKMKIENNILDYDFKETPERLFNFDYKILDCSKVDTMFWGRVALYFDITLKYNGEPIMDFSAEIDGIFKSSATDLEEDDFKKMLEYNGVTALYGISRGIFTSISSITFPNEVIRLPMLNIARIINEKHNHE